MSVTLHWLTQSDGQDRIVRARLRCYAHGTKDFEPYRGRLTDDPRNRDAEFLVAQSGGEEVGTATCMDLRMWARGGRFPCQGVAWVGTSRTHRRRGAGDADAGIATRVMHEVLRRGRERGFVVSALMPFRASYYEHFGYGLVERRCEWTVPLSVMPSGAGGSVRYYADAEHFEALNACRQRIAERGQCDIERSPELWRLYHARSNDGWEVVDQPDRGGPVRGWTYFNHEHKAGKDYVKVGEMGYEDVPSLVRQLAFLGTLRDQYAAAVITLPADLPLNLLLRETQVPHRPVNHAHAEARAYTRMQVRILDHVRFLGAMRVPGEAGKAVVEIRETEGLVTKLAIEVADGQVRAAPTDASPQLECNDVTWASIACGDLPVGRAIELGIASARDADAVRVLDVFARGPAPFTHEYF